MSLLKPFAPIYVSLSYPLPGMTFSEAADLLEAKAQTEMETWWSIRTSGSSEGKQRDIREVLWSEGLKGSFQQRPGA